MKRAKNRQQPAPNFYDFVAAAENDRSLAARMIAQDAHWLRLENSCGETALHYLAIENRLDAVRFLIGHGAQVDARDHSKTTPLIVAAQLGHLEMVRLLLEHGADVNAHSETLHWSGLHYAADNGHVEVLELLLRAGGRTHKRHEWGEAVDEVLLPRKRAALQAVLRRYEAN